MTASWNVLSDCPLDMYQYLVDRVSVLYLEDGGGMFL